MAGHPIPIDLSMLLSVNDERTVEVLEYAAIERAQFMSMAPLLWINLAPDLEASRLRCQLKTEVPHP